MTGQWEITTLGVIGDPDPVGSAAAAALIRALGSGQAAFTAQVPLGAGTVTVTVTPTVPETSPPAAALPVAPTLAALPPAPVYPQVVGVHSGREFCQACRTWGQDRWTVAEAVGREPRRLCQACRPSLVAGAA